MEAAEGRAPCGRCGAVNVPPVVNPYGPQLHGTPAGPPIGAQGWMMSSPAPGAGWACNACRHENRAHHDFCLGCGAARGAGAHPRVEGANRYAGNPATSPQRSPVVLIVAIVAFAVVAATVGVVAMLLGR